MKSEQINLIFHSSEGVELSIMYHSLIL